MENLIGSAWLREKYKIFRYQLTHVSLIGSRSKIETDENGNVEEVYPPQYAPDSDSTLSHLEFLLKYDDLNFDFLKTVFEKITVEDVLAYIQLKPKGSYERRIGYLYEFLIGAKIPVQDLGKGNYVDLIDSQRYLTGKVVKNSRWLINDNLLGNADFCPIVRRTKHLDTLLKEDYQKRIENLSHEFPPDIFYRAVNYLYTKETRSSYQIEKEKPTLERVNLFVSLLEKAGEQSSNILISEKNLTVLQNEIVDPRYAANGYRSFQNYIGQTTFNYKEIIHYICPPPEYVYSLMSGLAAAAGKSEGCSAIVRAAMVAFGFVFIHPFEDGNGRLHRFLIHDMLTRDKLVPQGMIIPVSAHMVNHIKEYDKSLEAFSVPLMKRIKYDLNAENQLTVLNSKELEAYFRYPDLTPQSIYLAKTIKETIEEDIYLEMEFLVKYDEAKTSMQNIVDMPDKDIDLLIRLMHQNKGVFPARKRKLFDKLTDEEILKMQSTFQTTFNIPSN